MVRGKKRTRKPIYNKEDDAEDMDSDIEDVDMNAITDSEEEYTESERKLLEEARNKDTIENYDSEEEVYGLQHSENEEEEDDHEDSLKSDIEELQDDVPDNVDWGSKAHHYYSSDFKYSNYGYTSISQKDMINANTELGEGKKLRTNLFGYIDHDADNSVSIREDSEDHQEDNEQEFTKDKNEYLFMNLINSFKEKITEVKDILIPFLKIAENETWSNCDAANGLPVESHPIVMRLAQYRQLFEQLQSGQRNLLKQIADVVKAVKKDKPLRIISNDSQIKINKKAARLTSLNKKHQKEAAVEDEELLSDNMDEVSTYEEASIDENVKEIQNTEEKYDTESMEIEMKDAILNPNEEAKRAITYQMAKNRGLTPYRKKELRNPRVKHRNKYRKAKIRRKGAVREVRKLQTLYQGEISGINAGVKKGIKIK